MLQVFSNAPRIFKLMLCNWNLTKLDILTLLKSDCREWALKLSEHLKKTNKSCFCLHFANSNKKKILHFLLIFFCISYLISSLNLCDAYYFSYINECHKVVKNLIFLKSFVLPWNQLDAVVFVFFTSRTQNKGRIIK